jgi:dTDP-4-dehydrorhamnose reductase
MLEPERIIITGGSGLLGTEVRKLLPEAQYPGSSEFNLADYAQMDRYVRASHYCLILHAAAVTSPPKVDRDPCRALETNIIGTANVVKLCATHGMKLIYVSTDYVFRGDRGEYREEDELHPVNKYAWSKLGGECAARMYDHSLIVRTSFGPNAFPYEKAFVDQWTSRESVSRIAGKLVRLLEYDELVGVIHLGGPRRTVYEYARNLDETKAIQKLSIREVAFSAPVDTSLNCELYDRLQATQP